MYRTLFYLEFPICLSIQLVRANEACSGVLSSPDQHHIGRNAVTLLHVNNIPDLPYKIKHKMYFEF